MPALAPVTIQTLSEHSMESTYTDSKVFKTISFASALPQLKQRSFLCELLR